MLIFLLFFSICFSIYASDARDTEFKILYVEEDKESRRQLPILVSRYNIQFKKSTNEKLQKIRLTTWDRAWRDTVWIGKSSRFKTLEEDPWDTQKERILKKFEGINLVLWGCSSQESIKGEPFEKLIKAAKQGVPSRGEFILPPFIAITENQKYWCVGEKDPTKFINHYRPFQNDAHFKGGYKILSKPEDFVIIINYCFEFIKDPWSMTDRLTTQEWLAQNRGRFCQPRTDSMIIRKIALRPFDDEEDYSSDEEHADVPNQNLSKDLKIKECNPTNEAINQVTQQEKIGSNSPDLPQSSVLQKYAPHKETMNIHQPSQLFFQQKKESKKSSASIICCCSGSSSVSPK